MAAEDSITPEEKLLRVIKGGTVEGARPGDGQSAQAAAAQPVPQAAAPGDERQGLRLAPEAGRAGFSAAPKTTPQPGGPAPAPARPAVSASGPIRRASRRSPLSRAVAAWPGHTIVEAVNKCLALVSLVAAALTGWEIFACVEKADQAAGQAKDAVAGAAAAVEEGQAGAEAEYSLREAVASYEARPLFRIPTPGKRPEEGAPEPRMKWEEYARKNLQVIGFSAVPAAPAKAILLDRQKNALHFLKAGDKLVLEETMLQLKQILQDHVVFTDGSKDVPVK